MNRWEIIAEALDKTVSEVTFMAYKLKDNVYQKAGETDKLVENLNNEIKKKIKTKTDDKKAGSTETNWTQEQQKALEAAIQKHLKRPGNEDRWLKIANCVPGKTKEECMLRFERFILLFHEFMNPFISL